MRTTSLTKQTAFLMAGRMLAFPLAFLVPIILVRYFSVKEFGYYKQLFLIFYVVIPIIDFGISNSLFYFIPKYPEIKDRILSHTFIILSIISVIVAISFWKLNTEIALIFTGSIALTPFIPYIGIFAVLWLFSTNLEIILIAEKKAFWAAIITFLSDATKSILTIGSVMLGGGLKEVLYALIITATLKLILMSVYLIKKKMIYLGYWDKKLVISQLKYAIPFGAAVIVTGIVTRSHQYIVSVLEGASVFAIYSVGCFQIPFLSIVEDSVAQTSLVRMTELTKIDNGLIEIALIISNSIRKLWILFFPAFIFFFINADNFVILLFTESYRESIPIFRIFILLIPLSAILIRHVPRAFAETGFLLKNNCIYLILTIILSLIFIKIWGISGPAIGYIIANAIWKMIFLIKCKSILKVGFKELLPIKSIFRVTFTTICIGVVNYFLLDLWPNNLMISLTLSFTIFVLLCTVVFWV
ncbi:oligosaccharide flippase family protein, partial [Desulfococcaceae bacterium HSG9]|nr:oligosaccharide flippase family protein [Desulfococcaceae bacterium HSG9]